MPDKFFKTGNEIILGSKYAEEHSKHPCRYSEKHFKDFFDGCLYMDIEINIGENKFKISDEDENFWIENKYQFEEGEKWRFLICKCGSYETYYQLDFK